MNARDDAEQRARAFLAAKRPLLIGGKWVDALSGKTFEVRNPADGKVISHVAEGDKADIDLAVKAARQAFDHGPWRKMTANQRSRLMFKLADLIEAHAEEISIMETLNNGAPLKDTRGAMVTRAADYVRYCAGWATKLYGTTLEPLLEGEWHTYTLREPIGVAGLIIPWNAPIQGAAGKLAPALAAGCTMVLKPAELTPMTALRLGELCQEAGIPEGVVNIVPGYGHTAGQALVDHTDVDKIAFTGSTEVGKSILRGSTVNLKRVTLELGGKSPVIAFPDADVKNAIAVASAGIYRNAGQICAAGTLLFAHERIFDELMEGVAQKFREIKVGPGMDPGSDMGPLVSEGQLKRVVGYMNTGKKDGAKAYIGGEQIPREGYFVQPTILTDTRAEMSVRREEIFGPVLCAMKFSDLDLDKIAAEANATMYGLAGTILTRDLSIAHRMAKKIKAGSIRVNGGGPDPAIPFGGYKMSGFGRERGKEGVEIFTELKAVIMKL